MLLLKKYQTGGVLDVDAMRNDIKGNTAFYKNGAYTMAGRKRLAAIRSIDDNQQAGLNYVVNDDNTFKITDRSGQEIKGTEGRGVGQAEGLNNPFFGTIGRDNIAKKEISRVMSGSAKYRLQPKRQEAMSRDMLPEEKEQQIVQQELQVHQEKKQPEEEITPPAITSAYDYAAQFAGAVTPGRMGISTKGLSRPINSSVGGGGGDAGELDFTKGEVDLGYNGTLPDDWADYGEKFEMDMNRLKYTTYDDKLAGKGGFVNYNTDKRLAYMDKMQKALDMKRKGLPMGEHDMDFGDKGKASSMSEEDLSKLVAGHRKQYSKNLTDQAEHSARAMIGYIDTEIEKLTKNQTWEDLNKKRQVINYLESKKNSIIDSYGAVKDMDSFTEFYGGALPGGRDGREYWDPNKKQIVNQAGYNTFIHGEDQKQKAEKFGGAVFSNLEQKEYTLKWWDEYKSLYGDKFYEGNDFHTISGQGTMTQGKDVPGMIAQLENGDLSKVTGNDYYAPLWDREASSKFSSINYDDVPVLNEQPTGVNMKGKTWRLKNNPDTIYYYREDRNKIAMLKKHNGKWLPRVEWDNWNTVSSHAFGTYDQNMQYQQDTRDAVGRHRGGGILDILNMGEEKLIPRNKVAKAQSGMKIDFNAINSLLEGQNKGFYPTLSGKSPQEEARIAEKKKQQGLKDIKAFNTTGFGMQGDYASTRGMSSENAAKDADIAKLDAVPYAPERKSGTIDGGDDATPEEGSEEYMRMIEDKKGNKKPKDKGARGPLLSTTGVNTPLGELQYGDIANLIFAFRAKNKKVDEVPVNLEKFRPAGGRDVLAARDIDAGMLNQAKRQISGIRSQYQGSDPIMNMISQSMATEAKTNAELELTSKRADYRRSEEDRVAEQMEQRRQQLSSDSLREMDVENKNQEKLYQADIVKATDKARRETEFMQNINNVIQGMQSRANVKSAGQKQLVTALDNKNYQDGVNYYNKQAATMAKAREGLQYDMLTARKRNDQASYEAAAQQMAKLDQVIGQLNLARNSFEQQNSEQLIKKSHEIDRGESLWR